MVVIVSAVSTTVCGTVSMGSSLIYHPQCSLKWPVRQVVKSSPFHGGVTGSNPVPATNWCVGVVVNIPDCHSGDHGFESHTHRNYSYRLVVRTTGFQPVNRGSIPRGSTNWSVAQLVLERETVNFDVVGSIPTTPAMFFEIIVLFY